MGCLTVKARRIGNGLDVGASRVGSGLKVSCGLVCSVNKAKILRIEPQHIFLMAANNYTEEVCVISNVEWKVATDI